MNIKIAVIDAGIDRMVADKSICAVEHFSFSKNKIIKKYKAPMQEHGTFCFKEILKQNVVFDILDINITDENNELKIENVILGIEKAIELRSDIINVSLGSLKYSDDLFNVCQKAVKNNIAIISAASHTSEVSYPSVFKNVVGIDINKNQRDTIEKVNDSTLSLKISNENFDNCPPSTSMASARFSGLFGKKLNRNPILDKFIMLKKLYGLKINAELDYIDEINCDKIPLYEKLKNKKIAIILFPYTEPNALSNCLRLKNIVAWYNHKKQKFYSFNNNEETNDIDTVLVINSSQYEITISDKLITSLNNNYEIVSIGKFKNIKSVNTLIYNHNNFNSETLSTLKKPVILITGLSWELGKFTCQTSLAECFTNDNFCMKTLTYNMQGSLYGFDVFEYPDKIIFPDIVCSINKYMYGTESNNDFDGWLVNVGGGMFINNFNKFSFGKLTEAYFHAANVDILIFYIPPITDPIHLELNIKKANAYGIKKIFFVISQNAFQSSTIKSFDGIRAYSIDSKKYSDIIKYLKENFKVEIFTHEDVINGFLYKKIVDVLN